MEKGDEFVQKGHGWPRVEKTKSLPRAAKRQLVTYAQPNASRVHPEGSLRLSDPPMASIYICPT